MSYLDLDAMIVRDDEPAPAELDGVSDLDGVSKSATPSARDLRARAFLAEHPNAVTKLGPGLYRVASSRGEGAYTVEFTEGRRRALCSCPDAKRYGARPLFKCRHAFTTLAWEESQVEPTPDPGEPVAVVEPNSIEVNSPQSSADSAPFVPDAYRDNFPPTDEVNSPHREPEGAPAIVFGSVYIAQIGGTPTRVRLLGPNPKTKFGRGFNALNLATGRMVTVASPRCLRLEASAA